MKLLFNFTILILLSLSLTAQSDIDTRYMLGYNSPTETCIWIQTSQEAKVSVLYFPKEKNEQKLQSTTQVCTAENAFCTQILLQNLQPATEYSYHVKVDDKMLDIKKPQIFRTQSLEKIYDFSLATGSCACLRDRSSKAKKSFYNTASGYHIYKSIAHQHPDYMLWLGDNIYLRNGEWESKEGVCYRYTHTRSLPQIQPLLQNAHNISTWDDHDYGMNNGNSLSKSKDFALQGFQLFWANPQTHPNDETGIYYNYTIADAEFFMTDDRYFRSPDTDEDNENKHFLGTKQLNWLLDGLEKSQANFKLVAIGTQFLNPNLEPRKEGFWKSYQTEAKYILSEIKRRKINGVIFLTGDVHYTMLSKLSSPDFYPIYDLTVSALTSIQNPFWGTKNPLKVKGTFLWEHNYAILKFQGKADNRSLKIQIRNKFGIKKWKREIFAKDLRI